MRILAVLAAGLAGIILALSSFAAQAEPMYRWDWAPEYIPPGTYVWDGGPVDRAPVLRVQTAPRGFDGCWQTSGTIYRRYRVAFCIGPGGQGAYSVRGGGYECRGRARWSAGPRGMRVIYQMDRGSCGGRADWTADRVECEPDAPGRRGPQLVCTYHPNARGYGVERFSAFRQ